MEFNDADSDSDDVDDLMGWNSSFGISVKETLTGMDRLDLLAMFSDGTDSPPCDSDKQCQA